jgi:hypothetical protein
MILLRINRGNAAMWRHIFFLDGAQSEVFKEKLRWNCSNFGEHMQLSYYSYNIFQSN